MRLFLSVVREHLSNVKEMLSGSALSGSVDEHSAAQLKSFLLLRNGRRILVFSVIQFIIGAVAFAVSLAGVNSSGSGGMLCLTGSGLLAGAGALFFYFFNQELSRRQHDGERLNLLFYAYWSVFLIGGLILSAGELHAMHTLYCFFIFAAALTVVPILRPFDCLIVTAVFVISAVIYGVNEKLEPGFYAVVPALALAYIWVMAEKYRCYAGAWIGERQMDMAAERCRGISQTDSLTGMLNKSGLTAKLCERYGLNGGEAAAPGAHSIAVLLIDVDNFRAYNHLYGHDASDGCLSKICGCIRIFAKPVTAMMSRFGGDEFVLILEDMKVPEILGFAEQIRRGVETMAIALGDKGIVTISVGVSDAAELKSAETYSALLNQADLQLMTAKKNGKNCVGFRGRAFISEDRRMTS